MIIYDKTIWENEKTLLNASNMQKIEDGIEYLFDLNRDIPEAEASRVQAETLRVQQEGLRQANELERNNKINSSISTMNNVGTSVQTALANKMVEVDTEVDTKMAQADAKIVDVENRFLYLTANQQQASEVLDARLSANGTRYISLKARIDSIESSPYVYFESVEG